MTDTDALALHRERATPDGMFLHRAIAAEIEDRLQTINKTFERIAVVTGFPDIWAELLPAATLIADEDLLDIGGAPFDLVVHALSLHWANDPVGQLVQSRRALKPDGLFLCASFGGQTLHELRACLGQAEVEITGGLSPRVAPMGELRDTGGLLQRAGFALPVADALPFDATYRDAFALMRDLRAMGETNALSNRLRKPTRRAVMARAAELYEAHFPADDGRIAATFEVVFLTGWAPDESQPKPLRPGSAQQRLADALNTSETKLPN